MIAAYNVQNGGSSGGTLNRKTFEVDTSLLENGYEVQFDLYNTKTKNGVVSVDQFAPFAHDAVSTPDAGSTIALFGAALAGLGTLRRFRGRK